MLTIFLDQVDLDELVSTVQIRGDHPFHVDQQIAYFEITIGNGGVNRYLYPFLTWNGISCLLILM
jgi:hypothetical protein